MHNLALNLAPFGLLFRKPPANSSSLSALAR